MVPQVSPACEALQVSKTAQVSLEVQKLVVAEAFQGPLAARVSQLAPSR